MPRQGSDMQAVTVVTYDSSIIVIVGVGLQPFEGTGRTYQAGSAN